MQRRHFGVIERRVVLIPKAVAIPQPRELGEISRRGDRANAGSRKQVFGEYADQWIDRVHVAVHGFDRPLHAHVRRNLGKARYAGEAGGFAERVVVGNAMIAGPLDIDRVQQRDAHAFD
jgi:hypothetical protein